MEEWKGIPGVPGYEASSAGNIRGPRGRVLRPATDPHGYRRVNVRRDGRSFGYGVHRLVCMAFHGPPPTLRHQAAHTLDPSPSNNAASNLRWATAKENAADQLIHGTRRRKYKNSGIKTWSDLLARVSPKAVCANEQ